MILLVHLLCVIKFLNNPFSSNFYFKNISLKLHVIFLLTLFSKGVFYIWGGHATRTFNEMYSLTVQMFAWVYASDKSKLMRMLMAQHSLSYLVNSEEEKF